VAAQYPRPFAYWDCGFDSLMGHGCLLWVLCVVGYSYIRSCTHRDVQILATSCSVVPYRTSGNTSTAKWSATIRCYSSYSTELSKIDRPVVHCVITIIIIEFEDDYCALYLQLEDCIDWHWHWLALISSIRSAFVGTLAKLRITSTSLVVSVCPSVRPHVTTRLSLNGLFLWNLI